ncbi:MAG TPA: response regulator [Gemmataceae bacterium]|nr:response regulator [Gemmataceae bacterium]
MANKPEDALLSMLAHEIRNPLAAVVNGVQILRQVGTTGPLAEQTLDLIDRQLKRVVQLMDELPNQVATAVAPNFPPNNGAHNRPSTVLVVEDNRDVAKSLTSMLRLWGYEVHVAYDGLQALSVAHQNHPQVVLLDLDLPGLDGFAVARHLKESSKQATVIAVTAFGDEQHRRSVREAGFDNHLVKPVAPASLKNLLAALDVAQSR